MNTSCNRLHDNIPAVTLEIPPRATNGVRFVSTEQLTNTMCYGSMESVLKEKSRASYANYLRRQCTCSLVEIFREVQSTKFVRQNLASKALKHCC